MDLWTSLFQIIIMTALIGIAIMRAISLKQREWLLLSMYYIAYYLGDIYYVLILFFYDDIPQFGHISEFSWLSSYLVLVLLMNSIGRAGSRYKSKLLFLTPIFTGGSYLYFIQWGDYVYEFVCDSIMTILIVFAVRNLLYLRHNKIKSESRWVFRLALCMASLEYGEWYCSCIWYEDDTMANPYYILELLVPVFMALFLPAISRVKAENKNLKQL